MKQYDIIIIGAGPAGLMAALEAQQNGFKSLLIEKEKHPRYKVCGGGLVSASMQLLPPGAEGIVERSFNNILISMKDTGFQHRIQRKDPIIYAVMRDRLDIFLLDHLNRHTVDILELNTPEGIDHSGNNYLVKTDSGVFQAPYLIIADGVHSKSARLAGWIEDRTLCPALECEIPVSPNHPLCNNLRFDLGFPPGGYAWVFPKKEILSIGLGRFSPRKFRLDLKKQLAQYFNFLKLPIPADLEIRASVIPVSPRKQGIARDNILLAGDAAGLADPVVAEGISHALLSGKMAIRAIRQSMEENSKAGPTYERFIKENILDLQKPGKKLAHILYDRSMFSKFVFKHRGSYLAEKFTDYYLSGHPYPKSRFSFLRAAVKLIKGP